jgi:hypothetical protein
MELQKLFTQFDTDRNNTVEVDTDLQRILQTIGEIVTTKKFEMLLGVAAAKRGGEITFRQFMKVCIQEYMCMHYTFGTTYICMHHTFGTTYICMHHTFGTTYICMHHTFSTTYICMHHTCTCCCVRAPLLPPPSYIRVLFIDHGRSQGQSRSGQR